MKCHVRWHVLHSGLTLRWVILGQMFDWASEERTKQERERLRCNRWHVTGTWGKQQRPWSSDTNRFKELTLRWRFLRVFRRGLASYSAEQSKDSQDFRFAVPSFLFPPLFSSLPFSLFLLLLPPPLLAVLQPQYWTWSLLHGRQEVYKWATSPAFLPLGVQASHKLTLAHAGLEFPIFLPQPLEYWL